MNKVTNALFGPDAAADVRGREAAVFIRCRPAPDHTRLVLINESSATTDMARRHGRAARSLWLAGIGAARY